MAKQGNANQKGLFMLIAVLFTALGLFIANIFLVFLPMVLIIVSVLNGRGWAFLFIVLAAGLSFLISLPFALVLAACLLLLTYGMAYVVQKKLSFYASVLISCALMAVCAVLIALAYYLVTGMSMSDGILRSIQQTYEQNAAQVAQMTSLLGGQQLTEEQVVASVMSTIRPAMQPALLMLASGAVGLFGLLNYVVPRNTLYKRGIDVGRVPPFKMFSLPKHFGIASALIAVACLIGQAMGSQAFELAWVIVLAFFYVTYYIQGIAFLEWWLSERINQMALRVLIYALLTILLFGVLIVIVGVFEQVVKMRKRKAAE